MASGFATRRWASMRWSVLAVLASVGVARRTPRTCPWTRCFRRGRSCAGERAPYRNFAFQQYENYPNHSAPYTDTPTGYYDSFGNFLLTGYDLFRWEENPEAGLEVRQRHIQDHSRPLAQRIRPAGGGDRRLRRLGFPYDGGRRGDRPLYAVDPLSKTDFNGVRFDLSTPHLKLTTVASRAERPMGYMRDLRQSGEAFMLWRHRADDSTPAAGQPRPGWIWAPCTWA